MPRATAVTGTATIAVWPFPVETDVEAGTPAPATPRRKRATPAAPIVPGVITPWEKVTKDTATAFRYTMAIELTMMPQVIKGNGTGRDGDITRHYAGIMENIVDSTSTMKAHNRDPHRDQFAVEVPSKPFTKWGEMKDFYDKYSKAMLDIGLLPHHPKATSGGGHIHVGPLPTPLHANIVRDTQNKPWLMWVFNEPDDHVSAGSFTEELAGISDKVKKAAQELNANPALFADELSEEGKVVLLFYGNPKFIDVDWLPDNKSKSIRYHSRHKTTEFRMFEAPADWEEQEAQLRFTEAYVSWIEQTYKTETVEVVIAKESQLRALTLEQCEADFRALLTTLGLPQEPYERMIKENLHERFRRGERV